MTGKTHQLLGITAGTSWYVLSANPGYSPATLGAVIVGSYFAALLPDIDDPAAKIWDSIPHGRILGEIADPFLKHRNITHSLLGFAGIGYLFYLILSHFPDYWNINKIAVLFAMMIAYGSHILADMFTVEGVPLFFPYPRFFGLPPKPFEGLRILTGKWFENLIIFPIINFILIGMIVAYWSKIKMILFK